MKDMANQALTTVGANREEARRYSKSKPGARGLFQLMPATYSALQGDALYRKKDTKLNTGGWIFQLPLL